MYINILLPVYTKLYTLSLLAPFPLPLDVAVTTSCNVDLCLKLPAPLDVLGAIRQSNCLRHIALHGVHVAMSTCCSALCAGGAGRKRSSSLVRGLRSALVALVTLSSSARGEYVDSLVRIQQVMPSLSRRLSSPPPRLVFHKSAPFRHWLARPQKVTLRRRLYSLRPL